MENFFLGLGLILLGFGFFQFSGMFNLYKAQKGENTPPWPYWVLRTASYLLMGFGAVLVAGALI